MKYIAILCLIVSGLPAYAEYHRSEATRNHFKKLQPCPSTGKHSGSCPGWVIDHVLPLACGGPDAVTNMQWQTFPDSKLKDKWEIRGDATHPPCSGLSK